MRFFITSINSIQSIEAPTITAVYTSGILPYPSTTVNILLAGQSNAVSRNGVSDILDEANNLPYTGQIKYAKYWNNTSGTFEDFTTSHNQYLADVNGDIGIGYSIAQKLLNERTFGNVQLTKYAEGGTAIGLNGGFGKWNSPAGVRLVDLKTMVTGKSYDYFIWYQGETDTLNTTDASNYGTNLQAMIDDLETVATFDKIIIVRLGDIPDFINSGTAGVRAGQDLFVTNNANAYMYTPDVTGDTFADTSHYDLTQQNRFGEGIADLIISQQ